MPVNAGNNRFNVGRDITVVLLDTSGSPVTISNVTNYTSKQEVADVKVDRLDSIQMTASLPKGWTGTLEFSRGDPDVDNLIADIEQTWYTSGVYNTAALFEYITETSGATTTWRYTNVSVKYDDAGTWAGDRDVKCRLSYIADRRLSV